MKRDILAHRDRKATGAAGKTISTPVPEKKSSPAAEYEELSQIRKAIARQMSVSKNTAAHMTVYEEVDISSLKELRRKNKEKFAERGAKLTYMPFIVKALAESLKRYKSLNAQLDLENNRVIYKYEYNIGMAVDAPDGLVVPVIRDADKKGIYELAKEIEDLAARARDRALNLNEVRGGTFSITNYGAIAGISGTPVLNYPEVGILGIGRIMDRPVIRNGELAVGTILPLSLTVDHRLIDGGEAVRFLSSIMAFLADPVSLLLL
jgi:pyruvate dehydrogenase E2 component (dihydrolipoamide acetyltransferase)